MLENTERALKNGQSRETDKIAYTRRKKPKQNHNTIRNWLTVNVWSVLETHLL